MLHRAEQHPAHVNEHRYSKDRYLLILITVLVCVDKFMGTQQRQQSHCLQMLVWPFQMLIN